MLIDLQKITTRDGVVLNGGVVWPLNHSLRSGTGRATKRERTAVVLVHGLMGKFYGWLPRMEPLVKGLVRQGTAVAIFNTRGHHVVTTIAKKKKSILGGSAYEKFEDCVHDIRAVIDFLAKNGYRRVVLAGHSTGANKAAYYLYKTKDRRVKKLILLVPLSDVVGEMQARGRSLKKFLARAKMQVQQGRGDELFLDVYPERLWSAKRYLSLYTPGSAEDVFPYYNSKGNWRAIESIRIPTLVVLGDCDQFLDRDAGEVMEVFQKYVRRFRGTIIPGADHSFNKREKELARVVVRFAVQHG